jgi:hypothetical protein
MALHYVVKSIIFEITVFAVASIVGYLVVYRWFRGGRRLEQDGKKNSIHLFILRNPCSLKKNAQTICSRYNPDSPVEIYLWLLFTDFLIVRA